MTGQPHPINSFVDSLCVRHGVNYQKDVGSPTIDGGSANWKAMRLGKKDGRYCAAHKMGRKVLYALGMTKTSQPLNPEGPGLVKTFKRWAAFVKKCRFDTQKDFHVKLRPLRDRVLQEPRDGDEMGDVGESTVLESRYMMAATRPRGRDYPHVRGWSPGGGYSGAGNEGCRGKPGVQGGGLRPTLTLTFRLAALPSSYASIWYGSALGVQCSHLCS